MFKVYSVKSDLKLKVVRIPRSASSTPAAAGRSDQRSSAPLVRRIVVKRYPLNNSTRVNYLVLSARKARRWLVDGSSMARRRLVKVIGFLRPCKSATLRSHYPSPKAVPTSLCPSSTQAPELGYTLATPWVELG